MEEIWKDIPGYEDLYQVSNLGRVKSLYTHKILKYAVVKGYAQVSLSRNGKHKNVLIHKLVAKAFIPNPYNLPIINHKDENKLNNRVDNLEWCTYSYNNNYGSRIKKASDSMKKRIACYTLDGTLVKYYDGIIDAVKEGFTQSCITECCLNKRYHRTHRGFRWKFID